MTCMLHSGEAASQSPYAPIIDVCQVPDTMLVSDPFIVVAPQCVADNIAQSLGAALIFR